MGIMKNALNRLLGTSEELQQLYREKGICSEYVDCYMDLHKKPNKLTAIQIADMLISVERYNEAEEILNGLKHIIISGDDVTGLYYFTVMNLYMNTGRITDANAVYNKYRKFFSIYFESPSRLRMAGAYYDNLAILAGLNGDGTTALRCVARVREWGNSYDETKFMADISYVSALYALGQTEKAETEYPRVEALINGFQNYKMMWQREHFLGLLAKSKKWCDVRNTMS